MSSFQFKHFKLRQGLSALKFGTDAMLLGAFATELLPKKATILDVGTGTGALALMLAQLHPNRIIKGIEIDETAALEATFNFSQSSFFSQLSLIHADFFSLPATPKVDAIISNPPYYQNTLLGNDDRVNRAKHANEFSFETFLQRAFEWTKEEGQLIYVFPSEDFLMHTELLQETGWFLKHIIEISGKPGAPVRTIILAQKKQIVAAVQKFTIRDIDNSFTSEYIELTKEFHSKAL